MAGASHHDASTSPGHDAQTPYAEVLTVPAGWWALGALFVLAVGWVFLVATPALWTVLALVVAAVLVGGALRAYGAVRIGTDPDGFAAGRALLPYRFVGDVEALDEAATRQVLGVGADARAYLVVRPYCRTAVKVGVTDRADPTPYWVVSSRRPEALAASLRARVVRD